MNRAGRSTCLRTSRVRCRHPSPAACAISTNAWAFQRGYRIQTCQWGAPGAVVGLVRRRLWETLAERLCPRAGRMRFPWAFGADGLTQQTLAGRATTPSGIRGSVQTLHQVHPVSGCQAPPPVLPQHNSDVDPYPTKFPKFLRDSASLGRGGGIRDFWWSLVGENR
jgi:hypothetical protein